MPGPAEADTAYAPASPDGPERRGRRRERLRTLVPEPGLPEAFLMEWTGPSGRERVTERGGMRP